MHRKFFSLEMSDHSSAPFAINPTKPAACARLIWIRTLTAKPLNVKSATRIYKAEDRSEVT